MEPEPSEPPAEMEQPPERLLDSAELPSRGFVREHPVRFALLLIVAAGLLVGGYYYWQYTLRYESTDDAQVDGHLNSVSTRVAGTITAVHVSENQPVEAGQLLVELDPRDYQVALDRSQANVSQAQAQVRAETPAVPMTATSTETRISTSQAGVAQATAAIAAAQRDLEAQRSRIVQAEANSAKAQADLQRYAALVAKDEVSREEYDQKVAAAKAAAAGVETERSAAAALERVVAVREAALSQASSELDQATRNAPQQVSVERATLDLRRAGLVAARAAAEESSLNLEYTRILAPVAGLVGRKSAEVGERVEPGQQLLSIIPLTDIWVTANFKETQVRKMRVGQRASLHVDAFGRDFEGYVESLPPASAARFSVLPPENSSGNYVKVVQRLGVRLRFKEGQHAEAAFRPGMSVLAKVWFQ